MAVSALHNLKAPVVLNRSIVDGSCVSVVTFIEKENPGCPLTKGVTERTEFWTELHAGTRVIELVEVVIEWIHQQEKHQVP